MSLGLGEIVVVLLIAFVVVGPKDLPKVAKMLAKTLRQMKALYKDVKTSITEELDVDQELKEVGKMTAKEMSDSVPSGLTEEIAGISREIDRLKLVK